LLKDLFRLPQLLVLTSYAAQNAIGLLIMEKMWMHFKLFNM